MTMKQATTKASRKIGSGTQPMSTEGGRQRRVGPPQREDHPPCNR